MCKDNLLFVIFTVFCPLIPALLIAQVDTAWVRRYNGPGNNEDQANAIAVDDSGNVYVTGTSTGSTGNDYVTIKYNSYGDTLWIRRYDIGYDCAKSLVIDGQGNVYVTGFSQGSGTSFDYATIKYNSAGVQEWVQRYNGPGNNTDGANAIAVDASGNVYVTGYSNGSGTAYDCTTIKYNSNGDTLWVRRYNGPANQSDLANDVVVDASGNVYVTGYSTVSGTDRDYLTIKYNSNGNALWIRTYNGPGNNMYGANAIAVDASGNVYVTGTSTGSGGSSNYTTIKYNSNGDTLWIQRYHEPANSYEIASDLVIDGQSNVYVTGTVYNSGISFDYATIKYNSAGAEQWVQTYNGPGNVEDNACAMAIDILNNVYVTGSSGGLGTNTDYATIKYSSAGVEQWVQRYNGPQGAGSDVANAIAVDRSGKVYVTGYSSGQGTGDDYATIKYTQPWAIEEIENCKLKADNFSVFPNPAKTYFKIQSPLSISDVKIFDIAGNLVKTEELKTKNCRVSIDGIKNGVYFVKVNNVNGLQKLVVTK